jgi:hypothetical protein
MHNSPQGLETTQTTRIIRQRGRGICQGGETKGFICADKTEMLEVICKAALCVFYLC